MAREPVDLQYILDRSGIVIFKRGDLVRNVLTGTRHEVEHTMLKQVDVIAVMFDGAHVKIEHMQKRKLEIH